jgi:HSP20 family protein
MSMTVTSDPPWGNLGRRLTKMDPIMQKGYFNFIPSESWTPNVNLYETDHAYVVCVDLAGVNKEKIDVEVLDNQLTLKGTREVPMSIPPPEGVSGSGDEAAAPRPRVHLMEIDHGAFCRQVELPEDVVREQITAQYLNGMLWVEIPKS